MVIIMRPFLLTLLSGLSAVIVVGCGSSTGQAPSSPSPVSPSSIPVNGLVTVGIPRANTSKNERCYSVDVREGDPVTVSGASGQKLGVGSLGEGSYVPTGMVVNGSETAKCTFAFSVSGIPSGQAVYSIEVGSTGAVDYNAAELAKPVTIDIKKSDDIPEGKLGQ